MSLILQIILGALVVGGVSFGVYSHEHKQNIADQNSALLEKQKVEASASLSTGNTNVNLDSDLNAIDGQLKNIDNSSSNVDASFNEHSTLETN